MFQFLTEFNQFPHLFKDHNNTQHFISSLLSGRRQPEHSSPALQPSPTKISSLENTALATPAELQKKTIHFITYDIPPLPPLYLCVDVIRADPRFVAPPPLPPNTPFIICLRFCESPTKELLRELAAWKRDESDPTLSDLTREKAEFSDSKESDFGRTGARIMFVRTAILIFGNLAEFQCGR